MTKYLLMRENRRSGPYSLQELIAHGLYPNDLVWKERSGSGWQPAEKVHEVKEHLLPSPVRLIVDLPHGSAGETADEDAREENEPKEQYAEFQESSITWLGRFSRQKNSFTVAAVFFGILACTFILKKIVDGIVEKTFTSNYSSGQVISITPEPQIAGKEYQNAIVTEIFPGVTEEKKEPPKPVSPRDIRKQIRLKGNEYTVGYFGGIEGLELTISNKSPHFVNYVEVEVNYLLRNGEVIETNTYQVKGVGPYSSQVLAVPSSRRGVKVNYKILNIYSRQYRIPVKKI